MGFGAGAGAGNLADFSAALGGGFSATTIYLAILIGGVTFTGSIVAWGKLSEVITSRPVQFPLQQVVNALVLLSIVAGGVWFTVAPDQYWIAVMVTGLAFVLGIMAVIAIGGADMPVVISLLNSYSGLAACAAGFVISKQPADHHRRSGGRQRHRVDSDHVQGDEPIAHQRAVLRLRRRRRLVQERRHSGRGEGHEPRRRPTTSWRRPAR